MTEELVGAVGALETGKVVALHDAGEAAALGDTHHIDLLFELEDVAGAHGAARGVAGQIGFGEADLAHEALGLDAGLLEVTHLGLGDAAGLLHIEAQLDGGVAISAFGALELEDAVGAGLDDGAGDDVAVVGEDLGHADLAAEQSRTVVCHVDLALDDGRLKTSADRPRTQGGIGSSVSYPWIGTLSIRELRAQCRRAAPCSRDRCWHC